MANQSFSFKLSQSSSGFTRTVSAVGGGCTSPLSVPSGRIRVVELASAGNEVASISVEPSSRLVKNPSASVVVVTVPNGSTAATETKVTFTNQPTGGTTGQLKVCKVAADAALVGDTFSFTENGGPAFTITAGTAANPNCSGTQTFQVGTRVTIQELAVSGTHVSNITVSDNRGSSIDLNNRSVVATVGAGVTAATFTNAVNVEAGFGFIEVCKRAADRFVTGTFNFTITAPGFTRRETGILVGQCTGPIQVPVGNVSVSEDSRFPFQVSAIQVVPPDRLVSSNLINQTVTVTVPRGDSSTETLVNFFNQTRTGLVKVCKAVAPNSSTRDNSALQGRTFTFNVSTNTVDGAFTVSVVAGAPGTTQCVFLPSALPLGSLVSITEQGQLNIQLIGVSVSPASNDAGSTSTTANIIVGSGITAATFTNQALGTIEVCKRAADASTATQSFQFQVNGGPVFSVRAGTCSPPMQVPAGTASVLELGKANFTFVSVTAVGPNGENRLITSSTANPATVSVPFGGIENETTVTFTNRVNTAQFKICKINGDLSLPSDTPFTFTYQVNGGASQTAILHPGECTLPQSVPVQDAQGNKPTVNVQEQPTPGTFVFDIFAGGSGQLIAENDFAGTATLQITGSGTATITYDNRRTAFAVNGVHGRQV